MVVISLGKNLFIQIHSSTLWENMPFSLAIGTLIGYIAGYFVAIEAMEVMDVFRILWGIVLSIICSFEAMIR